MTWVRFAPILVILVAVAMLSVAPAMAAKGGNGHDNGRGGKSGEATLTVEPSNPFEAWGQEYVVRGQGFSPDTAVTITMADPGCCMGFRVWTDSEGELTFSRATGSPGTYTVDAYESKGRKYVHMATVSFVVE